MIAVVVVPRSKHPISRRDIDPDALKVLTRLHQAGHAAYLVGGSVRDLLLGRSPKDFDIGTSAHPYQVKRLFRNCWIIGRRFRLAHIKFGTKTIEVATFRRKVPAAGDGAPRDTILWPEAAGPDGAGMLESDAEPYDRLIHRDNTFGTPEEDAFRRDFTVNALFYDIATFSIIDYVGGLSDLDLRVIRSIGDPDERMQEDPVRMVRAIALAARLDFTIDPPVLAAIARHRGDIARSAPARLLEEYYKILRAGAAEATFRGLAATGLLEHISPSLHHGAADRLWGSLARLDAYRQRAGRAPDALTTPILLGSLLVPLGFSEHRASRDLHEAGSGARAHLSLGLLPIPRRDVEQLRHLVALMPRLLDVHASPRAQRSLVYRTAFKDALTWLEIHGNAPEVVEHWRELAGSAPTEAEAPTNAPRRRRRRRRRRPGRAPQHRLEQRTGDGES